MANNANRLQVRMGATTLTDEAAAVEQIHSQVAQENANAVFFFCSTTYDLARLAALLEQRFRCPLIGCTTAGEISPAGYQDNGIVAASLASDELTLHPRLLAPLDHFDMVEALQLADELRSSLSPPHSFNQESMFGLCMIDGLSAREEVVVSLLHSQLDGIPLVGGSAGDGTRFERTAVYWQGEFLSNAALFTFCETSLPFYVFKTQHFRPTETKLVITGADPARRIVTEINAEPAAQELARLIGLPATDLSPFVFSRYPLMIRIGDSWHVRSVQKVNDDGSLSFFCAIDVGLVLTLAEGANLLTNLDQQLQAVAREVPNTQIVLAFDCILRRLEIEQRGISDEVAAVLRQIKLFGFNTYGEQCGPIHVNQTLTGVAIGG